MAAPPARRYGGGRIGLNHALEQRQRLVSHAPHGESAHCWSRRLRYSTRSRRCATRSSCGAPPQFSWTSKAIAPPCHTKPMLMTRGASSECSAIKLEIGEGDPWERGEEGDDCGPPPAGSTRTWSGRKSSRCLQRRWGHPDPGPRLAWKRTSTQRRPRIRL